MTRRHARSTAHLGLALVAFLLGVAGALAPVTAPIAAAATDGLTVTSAATYTLVPARSVVRVVVDVTARNDKPNLVLRRRRGRATSTTASGSGSSPRPPRSGRRRRRDLGTTIAAAGRLLGARGPLPVVALLPPGREGPRHVRPAGRGAAVEERGPGRVGVRDLRGVGVRRIGSVRIVVPAGFEAETSGSDVVRSTGGSGTVFTAASVTDVPSWDVTVNADRTSALTSARIDLPDGEHLVIHAWPDDPRGGATSPSSLSTGLPKLVEETGLDLAGVRRPRRLRGPHAAARGLRRDLLRGREPDRDQRGPRRPDDPPRGVARLVQRRPVRRALDQRGVRRRRTRRGPRRDRARRLGARTRSTRPTPRPSGSTTGRSPAGSPTTQTEAHETYGYDAAWTVVRAIAPSSGRRPDAGGARAPPRRRQIAYVGAGTPETVTGRDGLAPAPRPVRRARRVADRRTTSSGAGS